MKKTVVINAVGLTQRLIGEHTPKLRAFAARGSMNTIEPMIPAVTCPVQSTYLTGLWPDQHGIVGNGWYFRDECEVRFWRQSNKLVAGEKIWETARKIDPKFTCANLFWWFNMYSSADYTVTPRPMYRADGRKIPDIYTKPAELRDDLQSELGRFPLFHFWGPMTSIRATQWIADAALHADRKFDPTLTLIYLPHLDYALQRVGPGDPSIAKDLRELDDVVGKLIEHYESRGAHIIVLSEYGITPISRPVHLNRRLREASLLAVRQELGGEVLDAGASDAFAIADHQVAHVYVNDPSKLTEARKLIEQTPGVARVYALDQRREIHLDHPRSGELVVLAEPDAWFTYYFWLDDSAAPDFARTVDIHRKPGYDPVELFRDKSQFSIAWKLFRRKLGFRTLLDVAPLDAQLVKGSHGAGRASQEDSPIFLSCQEVAQDKPILATDVLNLILRHLQP